MHMKGTRPKELTVQGTIFPAKWDENRNVVRIVIDTTDEDEYFIDQNKNGRELLGFINRKVEITGTVRETDDNEFIFNVRTYTLLDDPANSKAA